MFGRKGKPKRVVVRRYKALTGGGVRKAFEKDANKLGEQGYRPVNTVDHAAGHFAGAGHEMIVTYELTPESPR